MKKINISIILIVFITASIYFLFKPIVLLQGTATVISHKGDRGSYLIINGINDDIDENIIIHSTIFQVGDEVTLEYYKKRNRYIISRIGAKINTTQQKEQMAKNIDNDKKLDEYMDMIDCKFLYQGIISDCKPFGVIPVKILNQEYLNLITPEEYLNFIKTVPTHGSNDSNNVEITLNDNFKILKSWNIHENVTKDMFYQTKGKKITFQSFELGITVIQIELENGDIINYLFY